MLYKKIISLEINISTFNTQKPFGTPEGFCNSYPYSTDRNFLAAVPAFRTRYFL